MADETCPYCKEPLSRPPPCVCQHCGKSIYVRDRKFPTHVVLGFLPAVLIGFSPLYATWLLGPAEYGEEVLALDLFILLPFTLIYIAGWALVYRRNNPDTGMLWMLLGSLMFFLNCALGFGGCLMIYGLEEIS